MITHNLCMPHFQDHSFKVKARRVHSCRIKRLPSNITSRKKSLSTSYLNTRQTFYTGRQANVFSPPAEHDKNDSDHDDGEDRNGEIQMNLSEGAGYTNQDKIAQGKISEYDI